MNFADFFNPDEKPLEKLLPDGGFCPIFRTIGCVGDSLSSGEFESIKQDGSRLYTDMYEYSWGQFIARTTGSKVYNFSRGGMTAEEYMESFAENNGFWDKEKACQAYILALGVNDVLNRDEHPGYIDDIADDYRQSKKNFAGYYAGIIQRLKEIQPNAKFFLMTIPKDIDEHRNESATAHAELIYKIADKFSNCYVLDFHRYAPVYDEYFHDKFNLYGHLNPCGYLLTAKMVMSYIDYIIRHNIHDFDTVGFIGKESILED